MCAAWSKQYGLETRIVRPYHTYGPGMDLQGGWIFTDFINDLMENRNLTIKGDGRDARSFCYIADATLGYFTVMCHGKQATPYNVGTGLETSIKELGEILIKEFSEKKLSFSIGSKHSSKKPKRTTPDITRLASLGWAPETTIADGFRRTYNSYIQT